MSVFHSMKINTSGLTAERLRMDTISSNIANAQTTRTEDGGPYRRKVALFSEHVERQLDRQGRPGEEVSAGVKAVGIADDPTPFTRVYDPAHPDADAEGYVEMPNVNMVTELMDMMASRRAYEANVTALNASKDILLKALEIGR